MCRWGCLPFSGRAIRFVRHLSFYRKRFFARLAPGARGAHRVAGHLRRIEKRERAETEKESHAVRSEGRIAGVSVVTNVPGKRIRYGSKSRAGRSCRDAVAVGCPVVCRRGAAVLPRDMKGAEPAEWERFESGKRRFIRKKCDLVLLLERKVSHPASGDVLREGSRSGKTVFLSSAG